MLIKVRWLLPKLGSVVEIYDTDKTGDLAAWSENEKIGYPCQILSPLE